MERDEGVIVFGYWTVKPGKEEEFINSWKEFAEWTMHNVEGPKGEARLIRSLDDTRSFVSFGEWKDWGRVQEWRATAEFRAFAERVKELCEATRFQTFQPAAHVRREISVV